MLSSYHFHSINSENPTAVVKLHLASCLDHTNHNMKQWSLPDFTVQQLQLTLRNVPLLHWTFYILLNTAQDLRETDAVFEEMVSGLQGQPSGSGMQVKNVYHFFLLNTALTVFIFSFGHTVTYNLKSSSFLLCLILQLWQISCLKSTFNWLNYMSLCGHNALIRPHGKRM